MHSVEKMRLCILHKRSTPKPIGDDKIKTQFWVVQIQVELLLYTAHARVHAVSVHMQRLSHNGRATLVRKVAILELVVVGIRLGILLGNGRQNGIGIG